MNKDGCHTHVHMREARFADLFEDFCKDKLPDDDIFVPPHHQPINPEDEDDVVPDQHAAFGIQRATQRNRDPAWRDLNLESLMGLRPGQATGQQGRPGQSQAPGQAGPSHNAPQLARPVQNPPSQAQQQQQQPQQQRRANLPR